jgi:hypothetical protein
MAVLTSAVTNVPSVVNHKSMGRVDRPIVAVPLLIEPGMLCSIPSMVNHCDTTQITSSNTSRSI